MMQYSAIFKTRPRPKTSKIIFLSCEGSVTEEEYFGMISEIYSEIKSKIRVVSVAEDAVRTDPKYRTPDQVQLLTKVRPKHLIERIEQYKVEKNDIYQFEKYPEDEFWVLTDVDQNWSNQIIDPKNSKTYKDEWDDAIAVCEEKGYHYAVSNPFFEIWLLYHTVENLNDIQIATGKDCKIALDAQSPQGYDPKRYILLAKEASRHARAADKSNGWFPEIGNTKIYLLIDALLNFVSSREFELFTEKITAMISKIRK